MNYTVMPSCILGERKRFPGHASEPLAQGIVPAFHVCSLAGLLADTLVLCFGKDASVGFPEVAKGTAVAVGFGYPIPKPLAGRLAPVAVGISHDLPRPAAQCRPRPHLIGPLLHVAAHLVKLQDIIGPCLGQTVRHCRQQAEFFLATKSRSGATPRMRAIFPAGSTVPDTPAGFPPSARPRSGRSVPTPCRHRSPCSGIAACRTHCARS